MSTVRLPTGTDDERETAIARASLAIQRGELIVIPTDTVYGIAADAFDADAVTDLLDAKGRGREMPPPVLVSSATTLDALAVRVPQYARALVDAFWPGPLTLVCHQQSSLQWDLGDTRGTVAIRMPDHPIAREILERTGPLAVSSANLTGQPAATDAHRAEEMLGEEVAVIVDAGPAPGGEASTIVDATGATPRVLRLGALSEAQLDTVLGPLGLALGGGAAAGGATEGPETFEGSEAPAEPPAKKTAARKTAARKAPAAKKAPAKKTPAAKKAPAASKAPAAKKAPVAKKTPAAKKTPVAKKTPAATQAPAKKAPAATKAPAKRTAAKAPTTPPAPE